MASGRKKAIGVIGASSCPQKIAEIAERVGEEIARRGAVLVCGGLGGVMEAACQGAKKEGGTTVGVIPYREVDRANDFVDVVIATGMGEARNAVIINSSDGLIAISGKYGTLSEIAFGLKSGKPIVGMSTWHIDERIRRVDDPVKAVDLIFRKI
ncbi:MAG: TIGR00725 family protein [bacterium]